MTPAQLAVIAVLLVGIAALVGVLGRRHRWSGRAALSLAAVPLAGLGLCFVFC
jgi:hypothetical protein